MVHYHSCSLLHVRWRVVGVRGAGGGAPFYLIGYSLSHPTLTCRWAATEQPPWGGRGRGGHVRDTCPRGSTNQRPLCGEGPLEGSNVVYVCTYVCTRAFTPVGINRTYVSVHKEIKIEVSFNQSNFTVMMLK